MSNIIATEDFEDFSSVDYQQWTADAKEAQRAVYSRDTVELVEGANYVRVLPPPKGCYIALVQGAEEVRPYVTVYQHFISRGEGKQPVKFTCPRLMEKRACPACNEGKRLSQSKFAAERDSADNYGARMVCIWHAYKVGEEPDGAKKLPLSIQPHEQMLGMFKHGNFINPNNGFDIIINRTGQKIQTRYHLEPDRSNRPVGDYLPDLLASRGDLVEWSAVLDDAAMQEKMALLNEDQPARVDRGTAPAQRLAGGGTTHVAQLRQPATTARPAAAPARGSKTIGDVVDGEVMPDEDVPPTDGNEAMGMSVQPTQAARKAPPAPPMPPSRPARPAPAPAPRRR